MAVPAEVRKFPSVWQRMERIREEMEECETMAQHERLALEYRQLLRILLEG